MSARKPLSVIAAATAALPCLASAQAGSNDGGADAGADEPLFESSGTRVSDIWDELDFQYDDYDKDGGAVVYDYDTEVADDFIVPEGDGWSIERVFLDSQYGDLAPQLNIAIWTDDNGLPGSPVTTPGCAVTNAAATLVAPADLVVTLPQPCFLEPGHYWLAVGAKSPDGNFFYLDVVARSASASANDHLIAVRSNCGFQYLQDQGLPTDFQTLSNACIPFDLTPAGYPNLALAFQLEGFLGAPPVEPVEDGGVPDGGTSEPDGGGLDSGTQPTPDGGGDGDTGDGDTGDGDTGDGDTGDGDTGDGDNGGDDDGQVEGGGCNCSTTSSPEHGLAILSLAGMALWLTRRRRRSF